MSETNTRLRVLFLAAVDYYNNAQKAEADDISAYTKEFAEEFIDFIVRIKDYTDNDCVAFFDDLKNKYPDP